MPRVRSRWRTARVAFAQIVTPDGEPPSPELRALLPEILVPGTVIERYGREWRMGQYRRDADTVVGRIGYQRLGERADIWDESANDFRETRLLDGVTSPFALNLENLTVAFQLRAGRIEYNSFAGAFQALLNEASGEDLWRLRPIVQGVQWDRWRESAVRVRHLELRMERPNPNYHGRTQVERIVEGTRARVARLVLDADDPEGLDVDDPLIHQAIDHALAEYGSVKAVGDVPSPAGVQESVWRSNVEGAPIETRVQIDPETREVVPDALKAELPEAAPGAVDRELRDDLVAPPSEDDDQAE